MSQTKAQLLSGTSAQDLTVDNISAASFNQGGLAYRNLIINGAMQVAQRGTSISAEGYACDRFNLLYTGTDEAPTLTQHSLSTSDTGPFEAGFRNSLHLQNGNQTGGAGAGDYMILRYKVEAQDLANSGWNYKSATSYITLSYWVKSSVAQNFYGYLRSDDGTAQLYAWETGSLTADTWTKITKTIPGQAAGNIDINNDNGIGMMITFSTWWGGNWTNNNTLNTWAAYDTANRTPDQTSTWYTTNDATFEITGVQLEVGDTASSFEHRTYQDELQRCMRYYQQFPQKPTSDNYTPLVSSIVAAEGSAGNEGYWAVDFRPVLRNPPTFSSTGNFRVNGHDTSNVAVTAMGVYHNGVSSSFCYVRTSGGYTAGTPCVVSTNNDATACVKFDSEL